MKEVETTEAFRPVKHDPPTGVPGKIKFFGRMLLDLHILTIYTDLKRLLPVMTGQVLDIGCGMSPYKFLLSEQLTTYKCIDIVDAEDFDYVNSLVIPFDGEHIPFGDSEFNAIICTEVLEHVFHYQALVDEIYRVCKPGAIGVVTVPFSARYHYIPFDFFRYTPAALKNIFSRYTKVTIKPRGNDVMSIAAKIIVLFARNLLPSGITGWLIWPLWLALSPLLFVTVLFAHVSRLFNLGSSLDPLGYTIIFEK